MTREKIHITPNNKMVFWIFLSSLMLVVLLSSLAVSGREPQVLYKEVYSDREDVDESVTIDGIDQAMLPVPLGTTLKGKNVELAMTFKSFITKDQLETDVVKIMEENEYKSMGEVKDNNPVKNPIIFANDNNEITYDFSISGPAGPTIGQSYMQANFEASKLDQLQFLNSFKQNAFQIVVSQRAILTISETLSEDEINNFYTKNMTLMGWTHKSESGLVFEKISNCNDLVDEEFFITNDCQYTIIINKENDNIFSINQTIRSFDESYLR